MQNFWGQTKEDLETLCKELGVSMVHAGRMMSAAYKTFSTKPWQQVGIPKALQQLMSQKYDFGDFCIEQEEISAYDGSVKLLARLFDGAYIEMVLMPESKRLTLCVSSQVGCGLHCAFCYTGQMGLLRNLAVGELVGQVALANLWLKRNRQWLLKNALPVEMQVTNIVFMGMGEPLENVEALIKAITILIDPFGFMFSPKRISVSTIGSLSGLGRLFATYPRAAIALSVHSVSDDKRTRIMPVNRKWPILNVLSYLREHYATKNPKGCLLVQYALIDKFNDSILDAEALVQALAGIPVKINLIPLNEIDSKKFAPPAPAKVEEFRDYIYNRGIRVMIRYSKGQDVKAACGQLVAQKR